MPLSPVHLSPHFTVGELTTTNTGLPNDPDIPARYALKALCSAVLEPWRESVGRIRVTSGFRSPQVNAAVGGKSSSQHARGEAADVVLMDHGRLAAWQRLVEMAEHGLPVDQAILYEATNHVHVSHTAERVARRSFLVHTRSGRYESWSSYRDLPDLADRFGASRGLERSPVDPERLPHPDEGL